MTIQVSREVLNDIIEALTQVAEYLEPKIDAEYFPDCASPIPNEEMALYSLCEQALDALPLAGTQIPRTMPDKKGLDEHLAPRVTNQQFADELNKHLPFPMFSGATKR